jgi:hypothetical protein
MNSKTQTIIGLLFLSVLSLGAYADFKPALARLALDRDRVPPGGTLQATYTFRSTGPAPVTQLWSKWTKICGPKVP